MFALLAAMSLPLLADAAVLAHTERLEHSGMAYQVTYEPQVRTTAKTIGAAGGTRTGGQWCRTTTEIAVDRAVRLDDGTPALTHRLAGRQELTAQHPGSCEQNRKALATAEARQAPLVREQVRAIAAADRPALLAQIEAVRAFAVN
ncbi:hypothetical protein ACFOON_13895 [Novosphingobium piscinae]|uniref:DUF922 domain-containing protein n=1 Tax=Novosphingobium piscinae TaxID=1507448 RepID=A0A7X1KPW9_9SPHN|nr:hypothetical protein [Novosphingobium piscinae]MBC2668893.1 hypothetical protein [Novosphingobium piscinae]